MRLRRSAVIDALIAAARADPHISVLWLQGSLARGDDDPFSDIDAYLAIDDAAFDAFWNARLQFLVGLGRPYAWSDATTPGFKAVHALLEGGVKLDLAIEAASKIGAQRRPAVRVLFDRVGAAENLVTGFDAPKPVIARILGVVIRMTRQGATWPLRLLHRGQWSTLAMMEIDLINQQLAQLMAVQCDPENFYHNNFSLHRMLTAQQRAVIDELTARALAALTARDAAALKSVHLDVYDALLREGRAACAALDLPYPLGEAEERDLRRLLEREWPG
jgi:hypothetical protein